MTISKLAEIIKKASRKPGVYIFNEGHKKLYIGKAVNLRSRLKNYLETGDLRLQKMIQKATSLIFQETESDIEALILESQLIKKWRPMFNIMLRDDKQYFYVAITNEDFPKIYLGHRPAVPAVQRTNNIGSGAIGPFTDGAALKTTLRLLRNIFLYCTCKQKHHNYCLNYHIGKCPGFCCLKDNPERSRRTAAEKKQYKRNIKAIKDILSGKKNTLIKNLEEEMVRLGKSAEFTEAITCRAKIEKIKRVFENIRVIRDLHDKNKNPVLKNLVKSLDLKKFPVRIEGYDISNIQGAYATGVMVVFTNARPDKNEYRKFKIKTVSGANDTAAIKEVLTRRFNHSEWPLPDLILIDGGKAQLNMVTNTISKFYDISLYHKEIPVVALAKDARHRGDHIFISGLKNSIKLAGLPQGVRNLILAIDAEAHRFAIAYYRRLHRKIFS